MVVQERVLGCMDGCPDAMDQRDLCRVCVCVMDS